MHSKYSPRMNEDQGKDTGLDEETRTPPGLPRPPGSQACSPEPTPALGSSHLSHHPGHLPRWGSVSPSCKSLKIQNHLWAFQSGHPWLKQPMRRVTRVRTESHWGCWARPSLHRAFRAIGCYISCWHWNKPAKKPGVEAVPVIPRFWEAKAWTTQWKLVSEN